MFTLNFQKGLRAPNGCENEMEARDVKKLDLKNRYVMYLLRKVAKRQKGMGLKLMKFHGILHLMDDILLYGVPLETDTSANESHHKPMKKATKLTQKAHSTFQFQTATRMVDFDVMSLAMLEIEEGVAVWDLFKDLVEEPQAGEELLDVKASIEERTWGLSQEGGEAASSTSDHASRSSAPVETVAGDAMIKVFPDPETGEAACDIVSRSKHKDKTFMNSELVGWLLDLQELLDKCHLLPTHELRIYTRIKRAHQSFRGHPNYRGLGPWRDWAWVNFGRDHGIMLCHIWCFVALPDPEGRRINYGGIRVEEGVYAVVESTKEVPMEPGDQLDMIFPIEKEVILDEEGSTIVNKVFYLADTDAITAPACVVPDIGGPTNRYFCIEPRYKWGDFFRNWLHSDLDDDMVMTEDEDEDDEKEGIQAMSEEEASGEESVAPEEGDDRSQD